MAATSRLEFPPPPPVQLAKRPTLLERELMAMSQGNPLAPAKRRLRVDSHLSLPVEMVKLETLLELELMATSQENPLAAANPETLLAIRLLLQLQESQPAEATQLLPEMVRLRVAGWS
jgi:hypothetical protein